MDVNVRLCGDSAVTVEVGQGISEQVNGRVFLLADAIRAAGLPYIVELVPAYASLTVHYRAEQADAEQVRRDIACLARPLGAATAGGGRLLRVPVLYGGAYGPDLAFVAAHCGLTEREVVDIHTARPYHIYMIGFTPGFPYLGGMDERIAAPRLAQPRTRVPAGSVGIAGAQTGVYPLDTPGGWQIIGRTPLALFDLRREPAALCEAGMTIEFYSVDQLAFDRLAGEASR